MNFIFVGALFIILVLGSPKILLAQINNKINTEANGNDTSVNVKVNSTFGTSNQTNSITPSIKTNIEIHQEGSGTSSVSVNGKEWNLSGQGDISVNENSMTTYTPTTPINTPKVLGKSEVPLETPASTPSEEVNRNIKKPVFTEIVKLRFLEIKRLIREFFSNLFY